MRKRPWRLADIVNFEYFLRREKGGDGPGPAGAAITGKLRERIAGLRDASDSPAQARRDVFRLWLDTKTGRQPAEELPGAALQAGIMTATVLLSLVAFAGGISLVLSLLDGTSKSFNVQIFFAATVLLQLLLLAFLFLGWIFRRAIAGAGTLSLLHQAIRALVTFLTKRIAAGESFAAGISAFTRSYRQLASWPVFRISQTAGVFFNLGLIAGFYGCVQFIDLNFYWESTFGPAMDRIVHRITGFISLPWTWLRPGWTPSFDAIQSRGTGNTGVGPAADKQMWYGFLLCALLVWGLLPRFLLRFAAGAGLKRALAGVNFNQRQHRDLWRDLTAISLHAEVAPPTDGAIVLNWNGIEVGADELHTHVIRQLRVNPLESHTVGAGGGSSDDDTLFAISQRRREQPGRDTSGSSLVVLAESWGLVPKRMREFHGKIRGHLGRDLPLHFLIVGAPAAETRFTPPATDEVRVWEVFLDTLNDPNADVKAFQVARHEA